MKIVILCGGFGKRLWPLSTPSKPKQFLKLFNNQSLFQKTILRNLKISSDFLIVVNQEQLNICQEQAYEIDANYTFIVESISKNTAPAITLAVLHSPNESLLIVPSDHMISNDKEYIKSVYQAQAISEKGLITFGIEPTSANTNYGYIKFTRNIDKSSSKVNGFKEKPNLKLATHYLKSGKYLWNSGIFFFQSTIFLEQMVIHSPKLLKQLTKVYKSRNENKDMISFSKESMNQILSISIDYALFEKSKDTCVIISSFNWSDLGTFKSLYKCLYNDELDLFKLSQRSKLK